MRAFEDMVTCGWDELLLGLGGLTPQQEDDTLTPLTQLGDGCICERFPTFPFMAVGLALAHSHDSVQPADTGDEVARAQCHTLA